MLMNPPPCGFGVRWQLIITWQKWQAMPLSNGHMRLLAWARTHLRIIDVWLGYTRGDPEKRAWLGSYGRVFMRFPTPYQT